MVSCEVCDKEERKYKCPACEIHYCSVACFKQHKEEACVARQQLREEEESFCIDRAGEAAGNRPGPTIRVGEGEEQLPAEVLSRLGESEELKSLLQNRHLRDFLSHVNTTHNPRGFMKIAMREPLFVEFADACLKVLHPERDQEVTDEQIIHHIRSEIEKNQD